MYYPIFGKSILLMTFLSGADDNIVIASSIVLEIKKAPDGAFLLRWDYGKWGWKWFSA